MHLLSLRSNWLALVELLGLIRRHSELTWEMTKREISDRYAGSAIGILWTFGHPLIQIAVYVFMFRFVFRVPLNDTSESPFDYTTYILAGLIPWIAFAESMGKGASTIVGNAGLVKQVVFPLEILPVKGVLSTFLTQLISTLLLVVYVLAVCQTISWTYLLLPVLFVMQLLLMIGVSCMLSAVGAYVRDLKEFVTIYCLLGIYLMPVVYQASLVPELFQPVLYLNPFSYMIWCYQDVCYFGAIEHPWAWPVFLLISVGSFCMGYQTFRALKPFFGNVL
jgi:homopolymeric O-antigen transport system permease protein